MITPRVVQIIQVQERDGELWTLRCDTVWALKNIVILSVVWSGPIHSFIHLQINLNLVAVFLFFLLFNLEANTPTLEQLDEFYTGQTSDNQQHRWRNRIDHGWSRSIGQVQSDHIITVATVAVADMAVRGVLANSLTGDASALKSLSTAQNVAAIGGRKNGTQGRSSNLSIGTGRAVSGLWAGVATRPVEWEDSGVASWTTHNIDT